MPIKDGKPECFGRFPLVTGGNQECDYCPRNQDESCEGETKKSQEIPEPEEKKGINPLTRSDLVEFYHRV